MDKYAVHQDAGGDSIQESLGLLLGWGCCRLHLLLLLSSRKLPGMASRLGSRHLHGWVHPWAESTVGILRVASDVWHVSECFILRIL